MKTKGFADALCRAFGSTAAQPLLVFFDRGFSPKGESLIVGAFLAAKQHGKDPAEVLKLCEVEWKANWKYQLPDVKADPTVPGAVGERNKASLARIYLALGIPNPLEAE